MKLFKQILYHVLLFSAVVFLGNVYAEENCITCHKKISPGQVKDWSVSKHAENDITCSVCHGDEHKSKADVNKVILPDEHKCAECHEEQFNQFRRGKHQFGWTSLNALPITHVEPDELMEGGRGCGGCHNMGIKTEAQKQEQRKKGYRYQNNSCDECHTRHSFSKKEALDPRACQQCHMGYDHPQWEMWSSSKHGSRWFAKQAGNLPKDAQAPKCQDCHMPNGDHENRTAWGFLGVRLPLPKDPQWAADRVTILKALGVLNPETGKPTARLEAVKAVKMVRLTEEEWQKERNRMLDICAKCHSRTYAKTQLDMGDNIMKKTDRMLAEAIDIVAGLYKDGILKKRPDQPFAYPDFLYFMRTDFSAPNPNSYKTMDKGISYIEQVLFQMYMKHRMRTYQAFYHVNPDYAYWYGWAMMTKDLGEIKELADQMRAAAKK
ncbi:Multiheme cytochrome c [Dissulfuribacter thermophilus]|uniref:Multiheme cytochrome c n=1 Tax=Dissulfuribacter thermophilus TaxID=1156395 RepID=A0A1B9F880_9BACT|nr:multiheme c-type cytochrome [Dissulfuribacter thermophilus]OCC16122.1 Multiheme cytochrome c [Dissulfuribacter thermophilus]